MKVIDKSIIAAMIAFMKEEGITQRVFAQRIGIHYTTLNRWLGGGVESIQAGHWNEILPMIMPYLDQDVLEREAMVQNTEELRAFLSERIMEKSVTVEVLTDRIGYDRPETILQLLTGRLSKWQPDILSHIAAELGVELDWLPVRACERPLLRPEAGNIAFHSRLVPVISMATAIEFDSLNMEEMEDWVEKYHYAPTDGRQYVYFQINGDSMWPLISDGDLVRVDLDMLPTPGDIVIVKVNQNVLCKRLDVDHDKVILRSEKAGVADLSPLTSEILWMVVGVHVEKALR